MLHDSCMFCTGLGRSVPYALGVSYRITDARRGFASVKLMVLGLPGRLTTVPSGLGGLGPPVRAGGPYVVPDKARSSISLRIRRRRFRLNRNVFLSHSLTTRA